EPESSYSLPPRGSSFYKALDLKETGKFFRVAQSGDPRQVDLAKAIIAQTIPIANERFHEALDDFEIEIIKAKSVFERDLSSIRAKRAARERAAAGLLRPKTPNGVSKKSSPNGSPRRTHVATQQKIPDQQMLQSEERDGTVGTNDPPSKTEEVVEMNGDISITNNAEPILDTVKTEPFSIPEELPEDPQQPKGLAITLDQTSDPPTSVPPDVKTEDNAAKPLVEDDGAQQSLSDDIQDADFESMFNDPDLPNTANDLTYDFNFSAEDTSGNNDLLDTSAFQNISLPNGDTNELSLDPTATEDLTTLLPGLENYVNGSNDFSITNLPDINTDFLTTDGSSNANQASIVTDAAEAKRLGQVSAESRAPIESSFEDMFGLDSYMNGTEGDGLGSAGNMGEVGDFDEDWFKTDGI
ncbi:MAG: hypothetical protein Q9219_007307, partial [cf. Caloplaca sp. 3 TL-2023]